MRLVAAFRPAGRVDVAHSSAIVRTISYADSSASAIENGSCCAYRSCSLGWPGLCVLRGFSFGSAMLARSGRGCGAGLISGGGLVRAASCLTAGGLLIAGAIALRVLLLLSCAVLAASVRL